MEFRTTVSPLSGAPFGISHSDRILMLGSCFSDNIGERLEAGLFNVVANPFGQLYNPLSIARALSLLALGGKLSGTDLFLHNGLWNSWMFHSSFSSSDPDRALSAMNSAIEEGAAQLRKASVVIITLGNSRGYSLHGGGPVVANCHKVPQSEFETFSLSPDQTADALRQCARAIAGVNRDAKIILTVSPIRHTAYGLHGNNLGKASLLLGADTFVSENPDTAVYFPAFEIMTDDLRDYRFYTADMKHPSPVAADYIYEIFGKSFFSTSSLALAGECRSLTRRLLHRPIATAAELLDSEVAMRNSLKQQLLALHPEIGEALERFVKKHNR